MSTKYPGGLITKTPVTPAGPYETGAAPGVWTLEQQLQYQKQGIWPIAGNVPPYIEDVFSTWLYQADGSSTQTINNGIDLAGEGGLVWIKSRSNATGHVLVDTARGSPYVIQSNSTNAQGNWTNEFGSFSSTGFTVPYNTVYGETNFQTRTYASWTFRKQPKFFDIVTYTGNGASARAINHNLGSTPGCMFVKRTDDTSDWRVYHVGCSTNKGLVLNDTAAETTSAIYWFGNEVNVIPPTSTQFTINSYFTNINGATYVAYLFAHDAGGFGLTGTDNVISCGSFTTDGSSNFSATLGYEPQWVMIKRYNTTGNWLMFDNMRGMGVQGISKVLYADVSNAEAGPNDFMAVNSTGFNGTIGSASQSYIYIAIRRGPMKVPTVGTSVFDIQQYTGTQSSNPGVARNITTIMRPDVNITSAKTPGFDIGVFFDRLRGPAQYIGSNSTNSESTMPGSAAYEFWNNKYILGGYYLDYTGYQYVNYSLQRAPGFFDEVCYTGNSVTPRTITHNLGVAPELMFIKCRNQSRGWAVYASGIGANKYLIFNGTNAALTDTTIWVNTAPTSSVFTVGDPFDVNNTAYTYVAYLFATVAGVSKVGTYTGNATLTTINCGFTGGARFVMIKRTDTTGNWFFWDTSRGMVSGTDPSLAFNTSNAESNANSVYTITTGFQLLASPAVDVNTNGGTYIFLAIA